jgi:hypothetical protein
MKNTIFRDLKTQFFEIYGRESVLSFLNITDVRNSHWEITGLTYSWQEEGFCLHHRVQIGFVIPVCYIMSADNCFPGRKPAGA